MTDTLYHDTPPVIVVGGSLVGLSAAVFLAARGVPTVLLEPHAGSHPHPRAVGYTARTLELYRAVGLAVPEAPASFRLRRARVDSLAGTWRDETEWTPDQPAAEPLAYSPHTGAALAQDRLEPMLRDRARALGAELRLGSELVSFAQDDGGVTAVVRVLAAASATYELRGSYLVAADGTDSGIRAALGIGRSGRGHLRTVHSVLFRAPLDEYLARGIHQFEIEQAGLSAFLTTYGDGRWVLMFLDGRERAGAELPAAIARAIGRELPIEILATGRWELAALVTDQFRSGRVFLAGDAAHTLPPTRGGFGANTGIHDAYDLAWKLAAVLAGESTPQLLETYDAERRPVAWVRLLQTFARPDYAKHAAGIADGVAILDDAAMEFGQLYRSTAVLGAGDELPAAARPDEWRGQPGTRAPHVWVTRDGARRSTLELFGGGWVVVAGEPRWRAAAAATAAALGIAVTAELVDAAALAAFGLAGDGASLVRPDGHVAWRTPSLPAAPAHALTTALAQVASATRRG